MNVFQYFIDEGPTESATDKDQSLQKSLPELKSKKKPIVR